MTRVFEFEWLFGHGAPGESYQIWVIKLAYIVLAAVLVGWCAWRAARVRLRGPDAQAARTEVLWLAAAIALALVLRLSAPASPMDLHHRLAPAWSGGDAHYGWGYPCFVQLLWSVFGRSDQVVFKAGAIIGSLTLIPLYGFAKRVGLSAAGRLWTVLLFATMPLHVRFSHTDNQSIIEIPLLLIALWAISLWSEQQKLRQALLAALCLALAVCMRPESPVLGLLALSWLVECWRRGSRRHVHVLLALLLVVAICWAHIATMSHFAVKGHNSPLNASPVWLKMLDPRHVVFFDPEWVAPVVVLGFVGGLWARKPNRWRRMWLGLVALTLALLVWQASPVGLGLLGARHQLRALPFAALLSGAGMATLGDWLVRVVGGRARERTTRCAFVAFASATLLLPWRAALQSTTLNAEYVLFAAAVKSVPDCCSIVTWFPPQDRSLMPPTYLSGSFGLGHHWVGFDKFREEKYRKNACVLYYRPASCFSFLPMEKLPAAQGRRHALNPICAAWEAQRNLRPIRTAELPARSSGTARFGDGALEVGFFAMGSFPSVHDGSPCAPPTFGCSEVLSPKFADTVYERLRGLPAAACRVVALRTVAERSYVTWQDELGAKVHATVVTSNCLKQGEAGSVVAQGGGVSVLASPAAQQKCPVAQKALCAMVRKADLPMPKRLHKR